MDITAHTCMIVLLSLCVPVESSPSDFPATDIFEGRSMFFGFCICLIVCFHVLTVFERILRIRIIFL